VKRRWDWIDSLSASRKGEAFYTPMEEKSVKSTSVIPRLLLGITTLILDVHFISSLPVMERSA